MRNFLDNDPDLGKARAQEFGEIMTQLGWNSKVTGSNLGLTARYVDEILQGLHPPSEALLCQFRTKRDYELERRDLL